MLVYLLTDTVSPFNQTKTSADEYKSLFDNNVILFHIYGAEMTKKGYLYKSFYNYSKNYNKIESHTRPNVVLLS